MLNPPALTAEQKNIVLTTWLTYAASYLGRVNLSPALPALAVALGASRAEVGLLGTALFWTYGTGQVVSGILGNRISARTMISAGLLTIGVCNLVFATQVALVPMIILWAINGFAHSTGWGPILRVLSEKLSPEQRLRISPFFPISFQIGAAVTWVVAGLLTALVSWQAAFYVPGILVLLTLIFWRASGVDSTPQPASLIQGQAATPSERTHSWLAMVPLVAASAFVGFAYLGMLIWLPTYVGDTGLFAPSLAGAVSAVLPLMGALGMVLSGVILKRSGQMLTAIGSILGATAGCLLLAVWMPLPIQIMMVGAATLFLSGGAGLTLTTIPMLVARTGHTSSVAGMMTAAHSIGGGTAGFLIGFVLENRSWTTVFAIWALAVLLALTLLYGHHRTSQRRSYQP